MTSGSTDQRLAQLLFWNRVWLTLLILLLLAWAGNAYFRSLMHQTFGLKATWSDKELLISSINGRKLITHLVGTSRRGTYVGARLPTPLFILDSEPIRIGQSLYEKLEWRNEGGAIDEAPPIGSEVSALYVQLERSQWRKQGY